MASRQHKNAESVGLPESLEVIGACAFANMLILKSINFPKGLKALGTCAFLGSLDIKEVDFSQTQLALIQKNCFHLYKVERFKFPGTLKIIENYAFSYYLKELDLSNTKIKEFNALSVGDCINLERILLPKSVKKIDVDGLQGKSKLREIVVYDKERIELDSDIFTRKKLTMEDVRICGIGMLDKTKAEYIGTVLENIKIVERKKV